MLRPIVVGVLLVLSLACSITSASESLHVGVIGGSGMIGQRIAREALERGHTVTLIVRAVRWTYVRPPARIAPGERTGAYRLGADELVRDAAGESRISMEDFAVAILDEIQKPRHIGKRFTVGY